MNTIYGIFGGCYSDWKVFGYFTTRKEAELFCEKANKTHIGNYHPDDLYVMELKRLDGAEVTEQYRVAESFRFFKRDGEWKDCGGDMDDREVYDNRQNSVVEQSDGSIEVTVYISPNDKYTDKSEKIARDELFRYLANKEGL